jgi:hypothetical protein
MTPPWEPDTSCCGDVWHSYDEEVQVRSTDLAWASLRVLTGGKVGHSAVTLRPCGVSCSSYYLQVGFADGAFYNFACGLHGTHPCGCSTAVLLDMPGEVARIDEVRLAGQPFDDWRLLGNGTLVRTDSESWPLRQDLTQDCDGDSAFCITYVPGIVPSDAGLWAAGMLACEFAKACTGGKCRLPSSVTSIARQGVTMEITEGMFAGGVSGIREVDAYVMSVNPYHRMQPSRVWSPDLTTPMFEASAYDGGGSS